jgi:hypothetical protein
MTKKTSSKLASTTNDKRLLTHDEAFYSKLRGMGHLGVNEANSLRAMVDFLNDYATGVADVQEAHHPINSARIFGNMCGFASKDVLVARFEEWRKVTTPSNQAILDAIDDAQYQKAKARAYSQMADNQAAYELQRDEEAPTHSEQYVNQ